MNDVATTDMTEAEAREFISYVRHIQDEAPRRVGNAYRRRAWLAVGYPTWEAMCDGEGLHLPREISWELHTEGLSTRAIGAVTGVSHTQVRNDVASGGKSAEESAGRGARYFPPDRIMGADGKSYAATRPQSVEDPLPEPIAGEIERRIQARTKPAREPVMLNLRTHTGGEVPYPKPQSKATFNETTGDGISWAAWSWNPVTGCLHGCDYCYARAIAHRYPDSYPAGFTPLFHEERLDAPSNTSIPAAKRDDPAYRRVFVCSMADLYGRWVPDEWIQRVHSAMLDEPNWEYLLLTKFPDRYVGLDLPQSAWVGTSVDEQKRVRIAERAFRQIEGVKVKWLSLEPLTEPLEFEDLSMFDWVVIGAQTETYQPDGPIAAFEPEWPWWFRLALQAHDAGCKVHIKPNLWNGKPGHMPNEYPGGAA